MMRSFGVLLLLLLLVVGVARAVVISGGEGDLLLQPMHSDNSVVVAASNGDVLASFGADGTVFSVDGAPVAYINGSGIYGCADCSGGGGQNGTTEADTISTNHIVNLAENVTMISFPDNETVSFNDASIEDVTDLTGDILTGTTAVQTPAVSAGTLNPALRLVAESAINFFANGAQHASLTEAAFTLNAGTVLQLQVVTPTVTSTVGSARPSVAFTLPMQRVGTTVTMLLPALASATATNTAVMTFTAAVPAAYRPAAGQGTSSFPVIVTAGASTLVAAGTVSEAGDLVIGATPALGTFASSAAVAWPTQVLTFVAG